MKLEMKRSDLDIMCVLSSVRVYEDINKVQFNFNKTSFVMDMDDCKLGFTQLRLVQCKHPIILQWCKQIDNSRYLSNELLKSCFIGQSRQPTIIHGPCF